MDGRCGSGLTLEEIGFRTGAHFRFFMFLFIQVINSPARRFVERWRFDLPDKGSFFRIWPPSNVSINWPGQFMTDRDADYVTGALYNFLMDRTAGLLAASIEGTPPTA